MHTQKVFPPKLHEYIRVLNTVHVKTNLNTCFDLYVSDWASPTLFYIKTLKAHARDRRITYIQFVVHYVIYQVLVFGFRIRV